MGISISLSTLLSTSLRTVRPLLILFLIDDVFIGKNLALLRGIIFLYFLNVVIAYIILLLQDFWIESTIQKIKFFIQLALFKHIQFLPISFFTEKESGYLNTRILSDSESLGYIVRDTFISLATNILTIIAILVVTFAISVAIASTMILLIPLYILVSYAFIGKIKQVTNEVQEIQATLGKKYQEVFSSMYFIKSFGLEKFFNLRIIKSLKVFIRRSVLKEYLRSLSFDTTLLLTAMSTLVVMYILGRQILQGKSSIGTIYAVIAYLNMLFSNVQSLVYTNVRFQQSIAIIKRIYQILDKPMSNEYQRGLMPPIVTEIRYQDVTFSYNSRDEVLRKINLLFRENEITAVVGESGVGKTTLVNLLLGMYDSYRGGIFFNNFELREINKQILRSIIGLVPQEPFLFSTTIKENISFGKPNASFQEIVAAAKKAQAHNFISKLPNHYETLIGEKGIKLSDGEKRRITLARAIIKNLRVLIIDEGTSQIDSQSENLILMSLKNLKQGRIIIVIAHRLATILAADKIFVLNNGVIVAEGNHDYLLKNCKIYNFLFESQIAAPQQEEMKIRSKSNMLPFAR